MANYFRITAYHPQEDFSIIIDSFGMFEKLWQFSSFLVSKGFKVLEVGNEDTFDFGNIGKSEYEANQMILRACAKGEPIRKNGKIEVKGRRY